MKIKIFSDLHLEFGRKPLPYATPLGEELVILAGDISTGATGVAWAINAFPHVPVVYVLGNHEFYGNQFETLVDICKARARGTNVHVLENDAIDIGDFRVLGCTLWTDFCVHGEGTQQDAMRWAKDRMNDFHVIKKSWLALSPADTVERFNASAKWLSLKISTSTKPVIVVTHHAPTLKTGSAQFDGDMSCACFHSNLDRLLKAPVRLWVHGHTHFNVDMDIGGVRVVAHQSGYPTAEVEGFDVTRTFDVYPEASDSMPPTPNASGKLEAEKGAPLKASREERSQVERWLFAYEDDEVDNQEPKQ
jgi:predicted phosphodiesterase